MLREVTALQRIGIISDTHGLLRPTAVTVLAGADRILHAGDIDTLEVLQALQRIAPVTAVRGNMDAYTGTRDLAATELVAIGQVSLYLLHDLERLDIDPRAIGVRVVISGHTHRPALERRQGVLYLNPGSAGPRRRDLPVSLAMIEIADGTLRPRIFALEA